MFTLETSGCIYFDTGDIHGFISFNDISAESFQTFIDAAMFAKCHVNCNALHGIMQFLPFQKMVFVRNRKQLKRLNLGQELWNQSQIL